MGREFLDLTTIDSAVARFRERFPHCVGAVRELATVDALGRVVADDVRAPDDVPAWPRAVVDGFAVRSESVRGAAPTRPAYLRLVGEVRMGRPAAGAVGPDEAVRIPTGGMVPEGADAVVMVEHTDELGDATIEVTRSAAPGEGINRVGEDFGRGEVLVAAGAVVRPIDVAVLAAAGRPRVACRALSVGVISTGDELVPADQLPGPGQVRDVNAPMLAALVRASGCDATLFGLVGDDREAIARTLERALAETDAVIVSGGSSVGRADFTAELVETLDAASPPDPGLPRGGVFVHGLALRPGKPTILGRARGKPVFGLPGHPASSFVVFHAVVRPCLDHLLGARRDVRTVPAVAPRPIRSAPGREEFVKVRLETEGGRLSALPLFGQSGNVLPLARAEGFVRVELASEGITSGDTVIVTLLD